MKTVETEMTDGRPYRHKKSGRIYFYVCASLDCTNSRDGTPVAIYRLGSQVFVREMVEFLEKFEEVI